MAAQIILDPRPADPRSLLSPLRRRRAAPSLRNSGRRSPVHLDGTGSAAPGSRWPAPPAPGRGLLVYGSLPPALLRLRRHPALPPARVRSKSRRHAGREAAQLRTSV